MSEDHAPRRSSLSRPIKRKKECRHPGTTRPRRLGIATAEQGTRMISALQRNPGNLAIHLHDVEIQAGLRNSKHEIRRPLRLLAEIGEIADLQPVDDDRDRWSFTRGSSTDRNRYQVSHEILQTYCPWGVPGGRLHVTEAWAHDAETGSVIYRADNLSTTQRRDLHDRGVVWKLQQTPPGGCRLVYQIVDLWIAKLEPMFALQLRNEGWLDDRIKLPKPSDVTRSRQAFANSWDRSTMSEESHWRNNPWVWVLSVRRVQA